MPGAPARPAPDRQTPSRTHSPEKVRLQPLVQSRASAPAAAAATASTGAGVGAGVGVAAARPLTTAAGSSGANGDSASARPSSEKTGGAFVRLVARVTRSISPLGNLADPCRRTSARSVSEQISNPTNRGNEAVGQRYVAVGMDEDVVESEGRRCRRRSQLRRRKRAESRRNGRRRLDVDNCRVEYLAQRDADG